MAQEINDGRYVELVLTSDTAVGDVIGLKGICGVAMSSGLTGETIAVDTEGVYVIPTDATFAVGDEVFYDASSGKAVASSTNGESRAGIAVGSEGADVLVKLNVG